MVVKPMSAVFTRSLTYHSNQGLLIINIFSTFKVKVKVSIFASGECIKNQSCDEMQH